MQESQRISEQLNAAKALYEESKDNNLLAKAAYDTACKAYQSNMKMHSKVIAIYEVALDNAKAFSVSQKAISDMKK